MERDRMQPVDKLSLAAGILWSFFVLYSIALLFPPLTRRIRAWELRHKPASLPPTQAQRIVLLLMTLLLQAVLMSAAFHHDLRTTICLTPGSARSLLIILTALYLALRARNQLGKNGRELDATRG
jgi:hypothetical protein